MQLEQRRDVEPAVLLHEARAALLRGKRAFALEILAASRDWPSPQNERALALRAQALALREPIQALEELATNRDAFVSAEGRFEYYLASARAYGNSHNFEGALEMLAQAEQLQEHDESRTSRLAYHRARLRCIMRSFDPDDEDFAVAIKSQDPALQFAALSWRSWAHAGLGHYRAQLADLLQAFELFERHGFTCDLWAVATSLHAFLRLAFELNEREAMASGERAFETFEWTEDLQEYRFLCVRALAWDAYLQGNPARAQWLFKDSKEFAPSDAWKVMAHLDRAYVARMNGNEAWALEELHQANALSASVSWGETHGEERVALVTMAVLFAPVDMAAAQRYVSWYVKIGSQGMDPTLAFGHDRRAVAFEKYAMGRVQQVLGNVEFAVRSYESALATFTRCEYFYRSALAAASLYDLTKEGRWLETAQAHASRFPRSALWRNLAEEVELGRAASLTELNSAQRELAIAIAQGLDAEQLSRRFSRSAFTMERQIESIATALGAASPAELRRELRRRGVGS